MVCNSVLSYCWLVSQIKKTYVDSFVLSVVALPFVFEHIAHPVPFLNPTFSNIPFIFVSQIAESLTPLVLLG